MHAQKLSVVIPVYCERETIREIIQRVEDAPVDLEKEIIIVDDASTDSTCDILRQLQHESPHLKIFYHQVNRGKGAALRTGFAHVSGDVVIIQDADLEYDPREYPRLLQPILEGDADVVYGSRFLGGPQRALYFWHYLGNRFLTFVSNLLSNLNLNDMETCYKAFRADLLQKIQFKSDRFGFEPEFTMKVARSDYRIYQVPISYHGRTYRDGKKINFWDGLAAFWHIFRFRFWD